LLNAKGFNSGTHLLIHLSEHLLLFVLGKPLSQALHDARRRRPRGVVDQAIICHCHSFLVPES